MKRYQSVMTLFSLFVIVFAFSMFMGDIVAYAQTTGGFPTGTMDFNKDPETEFKRIGADVLQWIGVAVVVLAGLAYAVAFGLMSAGDTKAGPLFKKATIGALGLGFVLTILGLILGSS